MTKQSKIKSIVKEVTNKTPEKKDTDENTDKLAKIAENITDENASNNSSTVAKNTRSSGRKSSRKSPIKTPPRKVVKSIEGKTANVKDLQIIVNNKDGNNPKFNAVEKGSKQQSPRATKQANKAEKTNHTTNTAKPTEFNEEELELDYEDEIFTVTTPIDSEKEKTADLSTESSPEKEVINRSRTKRKGKTEDNTKASKYRHIIYSSDEEEDEHIPRSRQLKDDERIDYRR